MNTFSCVCGSDSFEVEEIKEKRFYRSKEMDVFFKKYTCKECGESFFFEDKLNIVAAKEKKIDEEYQKTGILSPSRIRSIRKKQNLTQKRFGEILGKGDVTFSRYERGEVNASSELSILLRLLDNGRITKNDLINSNPVTKEKLETEVTPKKVENSMVNIHTKQLEEAVARSRKQQKSSSPRRKKAKTNRSAGVYA